MELLRDLHSQGATICMVTHDPRYASHADRTLRLFDGRSSSNSKPVQQVPGPQHRHRARS